MTDEPNGLDLLPAVEEHPTLDELLDRDPKTMSDNEISEKLIKGKLRPDRAMFIATRQKKRDK